jgi:DNA-binding response OmpR family regulator
MPPDPRALHPRALLIEDERSIRQALGRFMRRCGWEVEEAQDGAAGVALLEAAPPDGYDLVVTDLRMPRMSGFEVYAWLELHRPDLFVRLVIATADVASQRGREFLAGITRPVLEKPFELSALRALMDRVRRPATAPPSP